MSLTIFSPLAASPWPGLFTANSCVSELANRYETIALISTSLRTASSGELLFELYQKRGIQVGVLPALGLGVQFFTQSGGSLVSILVRIGPGFLTSSKPRVL